MKVLEPATGSKSNTIDPVGGRLPHHGHLDAFPSESDFEKGRVRTWAGSNQSTHWPNSGPIRYHPIMPTTKQAANESSISLRAIRASLTSRFVGFRGFVMIVLDAFWPHFGGINSTTGRVRSRRQFSFVGTEINTSE
jgi:hypothetical protein